MVDTLWSDVSEFQVYADDSYPYAVLAIRSNDGDYTDAKIAGNLAWCRNAVATGKLAFFIVYVVWEEDGGAWIETCMNAIGIPDSHMVVMIDVESWGGRYSGDHSASINAGVARFSSWLGDLRRVIGYGNAGDLDELWPNKALAANHIVYANYDSNPGYPGAFAHQFASDYDTPPFGPSDINSADGYDLPALQDLLGITGTPVPPPVVPLDVDGELGPKTITRWQEIMGTTPDGEIWGPPAHPEGSELVRAVQSRLNAVGARDWDGNALDVDGIGILQDGSTKYRTQWALQGYLGTPQDGVLDSPVSQCVQALQTRLNTGVF